MFIIDEGGSFFVKVNKKYPGGIKNDQTGENLSGNPLKKNVKRDILLKNEKLKKAEGKR